MAVLMVNAQLGVRKRRPDTTDPQGFIVKGALGSQSGPWPGRVNQRSVHGPVSIGLDVAAWPLEPQDVVVEPATGRTWLIVTAELIRNAAEDDADYVRVDARQQDAAAAQTWSGEPL